MDHVSLTDTVVNDNVSIIDTIGNLEAATRRAVIALAQRLDNLVTSRGAVDRVEQEYGVDVIGFPSLETARRLFAPFATASRTLGLLGRERRFLHSRYIFLASESARSQPAWSFRASRRLACAIVAANLACRACFAFFTEAAVGWCSSWAAID